MDDVRLIDANIVMSKLKAEVDNIPKHTNYPIGIADGINYAMATIDCSPTVDAKPVKHGHWIIDEDELVYGKHKKIWALRCSECGKDPIKHIGGGLSNWWFQTPEFCPVCGADMRGETDVLH